MTFAVSRAEAVTGGKTYDLSASGSASMFGSLCASAEDGQAISDTDACYYQASFLSSILTRCSSGPAPAAPGIPSASSTLPSEQRGTRYEGTVVVTVSGDDTITASGAFLKTLDAAGQVAQHYPTRSASVSGSRTQARDGC